MYAVCQLTAEFMTHTSPLAKPPTQHKMPLNKIRTGPSEPMSTLVCLRSGPTMSDKGLGSDDTSFSLSRPTTRVTPFAFTVSTHSLTVKQQIARG